MQGALPELSSGLPHRIYEIGNLLMGKSTTLSKAQQQTGIDCFSIFLVHRVSEHYVVRFRPTSLTHESRLGT